MTISILKGRIEMIDNFIKFFESNWISLVAALIIMLIGIISSKLIIRIMSRGLEKSRIDATAHGFFKSLTNTVLYIFVLVIALSVLGVPMTSIIAVIGAAGLAIGLALQNSLSNIAGGFIILFSKPFKVGDFIETNDISGSVDSINILYTRLLTPDKKSVYVPNGNITSATIVNYTDEPVRRLDMVFKVSYDCDYRRAISIIERIIDDHPLALDEPEPFIRMVDMNEGFL
ncbi:MAG: mechanosensitive ion channel, partial [Clostridiales bacterium]|nr:mechanosensitive ion channel [Clostridiales bacterium]